MSQMPRLDLADLIDAIPGPDDYWQIANNVMRNNGICDNSIQESHLNPLVSDAIAWYRYVRYAVLMLDMGKFDEANTFLQLAYDIDKTYHLNVVVDTIIPRLLDFCPEFASVIRVS